MTIGRNDFGQKWLWTEMTHKINDSWDKWREKMAFDQMAFDQIAFDQMAFDKNEFWPK